MFFCFVFKFSSSAPVVVQRFPLFAKAGDPGWNPEAARRLSTHQTTVPRKRQDVQHFMTFSGSPGLPTRDAG